MRATATECLFIVLDDPAFELYVSIKGTGSVTIKDMVCREYTVEQQNDWSWRYNDTSQKMTVSEGTTSTVTFGSAPVKNKWLNGSTWCENRWATKTAIKPTDNN